MIFLFGMTRSWFKLPIGFDAQEKLIMLEPDATLWWKWLCLGCVLLIAVVAWRYRNSGRIKDLISMGFAALLPLILLYPQRVIIHDDYISGNAAWLQQQFDNLTWLGGDIPRAHSERPVPDGLALWAQDPPNRLAAFRPPLVRVTALGISDLADLIWWLGYNPAFTQFIGYGWILVLVGDLMIVIGLFAVGERQETTGERKKLLKHSAYALIISSTVIGAVAMYPFVMGGSELLNVRTLTRSWKAEPALQSLDRAQIYMPALRFDTGVIHQRGSLCKHLKKGDSPATKLFEAHWLLSQGYPRRSAVIVEDLVYQDKGISIAEKRETLRSLLRAAVDDLNSNRISEAKRRLILLLEKDPVCLQGWFHYQLAALQSADLEANRLAARRIEVLSKSFHRKESRGIIAASQGMLAQAESRLGHTSETVIARQRSQGVR
jgi:hypothetical protein